MLGKSTFIPVLKAATRAVTRVCEHPIEFTVGGGLWILALLSRARRDKRPIDVGIGPEPIVSHRHQKESFRRQGYSAETFAQETYFITDAFDVRVTALPEYGWLSPYLEKLSRAVWLFARIMLRYRCVVMHFNGGPLAGTRHLSKIEPRLLKKAAVRVVVSPYGSDIQDLRFTGNLEFKHALVVDYPLAHRTNVRVRRNLDRWTRHADYVIAGCDWVDYMYHWDALWLTDWCIEAAPDKRAATRPSPGGRSLRVLHAPNHTTIKGTDHLKRAVDVLRDDGLDIELVLLQRLPNHEILRAIESADIVADQFVIGWYGFFALEAMAAGKPVMTYLKREYLDLQAFAGNVGSDGIPIINTRYDQIVEQLRWAYSNRDALLGLGQRSRRFVNDHHSLEVIGKRYGAILDGFGIRPRHLPSGGGRGVEVHEPRPAMDSCAA